MAYGGTVERPSGQGDAPEDEKEQADRESGWNQFPRGALVGLFIIALFVALYFARDLFIPIALALLLTLLLAPLVRRLARFGVPEGVGAAVVVLLLFAGVGTGMYQLAAPAAEWAAQAPRDIAQVRERLEVLRRPIEEVQQATQQVEEATTIEGAGAPEVVVRGPGLAETFLTGTGRVIATVVMTTILLYFMLASGDLVLRKTVRILPRLQDKKRAVDIFRQAERDISTYLVTITLVNIGLGAATAGAMYLLGMPTPLLWGVVAAVLNYVPYLGPMTTIGVIGLASLLTFEELTQAVLPPLVFFGLTALEGQLLTPLFLGRRLTLNPVAVFLALLVWGWLWGIPGILLAVPLLATFKIFCDNIEPLAPIGEFLDRR